MGDSDKASTTSSVKGIMKRQVVIGEGGGGGSQLAGFLWDSATFLPG